MSFSEAQKRAIRHKDGPALVLAGPGSGKTTVITNRVRYLTEKYGVQAGSILVITFTRAAAREMKERYEKMTGQGSRVAFGTFHSVFFLILKLAYGYQASNIVREEQRIRFIREQAERMQLDLEDPAEFTASVLSEISMVKGEMMPLAHYYPKSCSEEVFKALYEGYEDQMRREKLLDFDDMLSMCYELFKARPDILTAWQKKYQYILIDEFQDINRVQYEIVKMLALPQNNLFIVGDDDQSIYRFRGARPELMLGFEKDYPEAERILLDINYRSVSTITESAGKVISNNKTRFPKEICALRGTGRPVDICLWPDPVNETLAIVSQLRDYAQMGIPYEEIAVLYRTNLGPRLLIEKLMEYNIPFHMRDTVPNLYEHWIAKNLFSYIKAARGDLSRANVMTFINRPARYISRDALEGSRISWEQVKSFYQDKGWMVERVEQLEYDLAMIRPMAPAAAVNYIRKAVAYDDFIREYEITFIIIFSMLVTVVIFYIIYKNRQEKSRLLKRAQRDALTGLFNKKTTQDMIDRFLEENGKDRCNALIIMDVDYFKQVNDTYGHMVGDKVLKIFGRLLAKQFREKDIVGRIGGDEFMVLICNIKDVEIAKDRAKKLINEVRALQIPELAGSGITISVGIAYSPDHGTTFMELYRHADTALYQVKRGGRDGFSVYEKAN